MRSRAQIGWAGVLIAAGLLAAWLTRGSRTPSSRSDRPSQATSVWPSAPSREQGALSPRGEAVRDVASAAPSKQNVVDSAGSVERDPRSPQYDAARLLDMLHVGARDIFEAEPRDETWASKREHEIVAAAIEDLKMKDPDVSLTAECHTGICRVRIGSKDSFLTGSNGPYPFSCMSTRASIDSYSQISLSDGSKALDVFMVFGGKIRNIDDFSKWRYDACIPLRDSWLVEAARRK